MEENQLSKEEKEKQENQNKELDTLIEIRDLLKIKSK